MRYGYVSALPIVRPTPCASPLASTLSAATSCAISDSRSCTIPPRIDTSRIPTSRSPSVAHQRCWVSPYERPSALNGPTRSNSIAGIASDQATPSQISGTKHGIQATSENSVKMSHSTKIRGARPSAVAQRLADGRLLTQPRVADGLEAGAEAHEQRDRPDHERDPVADERGRVRQLARLGGRLRNQLELFGIDRRDRHHVEQRQRRHQQDRAPDQGLPIAQHDFDPRVEDLADAQRPQRRRGRSHGREGTEEVGFMRRRRPSPAGSRACRTRRPTCPGHPAPVRPRRSNRRSRSG